MASRNGNRDIRLTVAQAVVKFLQVQYSERDGQRRRLIPAIFGIFGHGNIAGLAQALVEYGDDLPYYQPCNEQSMVHTAAGYAKATRRCATFACTSSIGPGATNMVTGAALASINRLPVLLLPSDYYASRRQGPVLQQLEHPISLDVSVNDCFRPVSRFFDRVSRPEQLLETLPQAMRVLTDPAETGAVTVAVPQDVWSEAGRYPAAFFEERVWEIERRLPRPAAIERAGELLRSCERPLIIAGGGVHYAEAFEEIEAFAEGFGIPVGETFAGKGALRNGSSMLLGGLGVTGTGAAAQIAREADLVICVGTRLTDFTTGSRGLFQHPEVRFVSINVTGHDAHKHAALPILADAREALRALSKAAVMAGLQPSPDYAKEIAAAKRDWKRVVREAYQQVPGEVMSQNQLISVLNEEAREGDTVVAAAGSPPGDLLKLWDCSGGRACHLEFGYSCMAYELPAGLGLRLAKPDGEVYVLIGDGTYLMNPTELVTAVQESLKVTVVVAENHGYQCIRALQLATSGQSFGNEFRARNPASSWLDGQYVAIDFAKNAESLGAHAWHVNTPEGLRDALREAREEVRPCVIVVDVEKYRGSPANGVWWDVAPAEVSEDPETQRLRSAYEESRRAQQRVYVAGPRERVRQ